MRLPPLCGTKVKIFCNVILLIRIHLILVTSQAKLNMVYYVYFTFIEIYVERIQKI